MTDEPTAPQLFIPAKRRLGRPPIGDVSCSTTIGLRLTPAQRLELQQVAVENHTGISGVIRDAVNEYCAEQRERRGLLPLGVERR